MVGPAKHARVYKRTDANPGHSALRAAPRCVGLQASPPRNFPASAYFSTLRPSRPQDFLAGPAHLSASLRGQPLTSRDGHVDSDMRVRIQTRPNMDAELRSHPKFK